MYGFQVTIQTRDPHRPDLIRMKVNQGKPELMIHHPNVAGVGIDLSPLVDLRGKTGAGYQATGTGYVNFIPPPTPAELDQVRETARNLFGQDFEWIP
jgi:hypothetical protein